MMMADHLHRAREAADSLAGAIDRYREASEALRSAVMDETFAEGAGDYAQSIDPSALTARQKRRVRDYLGPAALATLTPDPEYARNGFSRDFVVETILREEADIGEARLGAVDLAQLLASEHDSEALARGVAQSVARIRIGAALLAPDGNHQFNLDQSFAALAVQSAASEGEPRRLANEALKRRAEQARIAGDAAHPAWKTLTAALAAAGLIDAAPAATGPDDAPGDDPGDGRDGAADPIEPSPGVAAGAPAALEEDHTMPDQSDDACCDRIVDALSRLQEGAGSAASGGAGTLSSSAFGAALEQQIYASIGLPNLASDTALSTGKAKLADKLTVGLDRAILRSRDGEITRFAFHPTRARALAPLDGSEAQGAQAVVAEAAANLKPAILHATHALKPEVCTCSEEEIEDVKRDIESGLDTLIRELRSGSGVYGLWALTLLARVARDAATLIGLYGIGAPPPDRFDAINRVLRAYALFDTPWPFEDTAAQLDRDVGFLDREANEQATTTIFEHLASLADLIADLIQRSQGATLVRLRAQIEAIPPAVADARSALSRAGVSEVDLKATFLDPRDEGGGPAIVRSIELNRLFDWIESAANAWRAELQEESLNIRDLRWVRDTLAVQHIALRGAPKDAPEALDPLKGSPLDADDLPTINPNRYALGLRQIAELARRIGEALALAKQLYAATSQTALTRRAVKPASIYAQD